MTERTPNLGDIIVLQGERFWIIAYGEFRDTYAAVSLDNRANEMTFKGGKLRWNPVRNCWIEGDVE